MGILHLEYKEAITRDYSKNYMEIFYDEEKNAFKKIYIYNSQYGTIKVKNNKKETHKWETEDEAKDGSYLKRNFQIICLDGIANDEATEQNIINENLEYIKTLNLGEKETAIIEKAVALVKEIN